MELMKISTSHWSYRLISFAFGKANTEEWARYYNIDSCKYTRKVFWASAWVMVATFLALWYGAAFTVSTILMTLTVLNTSIPWSEVLRFVGDDLRDNYGMIWTIQFITVFATIFVPLCMAIVFGIMWAIGRLADWVNRDKPKTPPSKTNELYTAWKEKYCVPVEFE